MLLSRFVAHLLRVIVALLCSDDSESKDDGDVLHKEEVICLCFTPMLRLGEKEGDIKECLLVSASDKAVRVWFATPEAELRPWGSALALKEHHQVLPPPLICVHIATA
jgi:hypothetical protein